MASRLLRMIDNLPKENIKAQECSSVLRYEYSCPCDSRLFSLDLPALWDMGLDEDSFDIQRCVFLDTETTGLSGGAGTVAFLVGYGYVEDNLFKVKQLLIPDYSCEVEMLTILSYELSRFDTVIHFNGKRFDVPLLQNRCVLKRLEDFTLHLAQLDLLLPARRIWKLRLNCCRLSYLESAVLGMPERDDIPGSEIPTRFFESMKTGNRLLLEDIVTHNRQDIVTLTTLLCTINAIYKSPVSQSDTIDLYSTGRTFEHLGQLRVARNLYLKASVPRIIRSYDDLRHEKYSGEANLRLYLLARRAKDYTNCEFTLLNMIKRKQMGSLPYLELCKLYEHHLKDYKKALDVCQKLLAISDGSDSDELNRRYKRIENKLYNQEVKNV